MASEMVFATVMSAPIAATVVVFANMVVPVVVGPERIEPLCVTVTVVTPPVVAGRSPAVQPARRRAHAIAVVIMIMVAMDQQASNQQARIDNAAWTVLGPNVPATISSPPKDRCVQQTPLRKWIVPITAYVDAPPRGVAIMVGYPNPVLQGFVPKAGLPIIFTVGITPTTGSPQVVLAWRRTGRPLLQRFWRRGQIPNFA